MDKFKWKIISYQLAGAHIKLVVDFGYGWKEITETLEDGTVQTRYEGHVEREIIELPFLMTTEQIQKYLDLYWSNKYGPLDTYYTTLNDLDSIIGLSSQ